MNKVSGFPDIRSLLILVIVITVFAVILNSLLALLVLLVISLIALGLAPIPLGKLIKRLRGYRWLIFILILVQSLTHSGGKVYLQWRGYVFLSAGGLEAALGVLLRIVIILAVALLLTQKDYQELATGLAQMKVPYELAFMVLLAVRFLPTLREEFRDSLAALQLRGVEIEIVPLGKRLGLYYYLLLPTTGVAMVRAQRIAIAMEARGFRAYPRRTWLEWPSLSAMDWLIIAFAVVGGGLTILLMFLGVLT